MKKVTLIIFLGMAVAAVAALESPLEWKSTTIDLGEIKAREPVDLEFELTNMADLAVEIVEAKGSCGCTAVEYPKTAIAPGNSANIRVTYDAKKVGVFKKNIRIKTSASNDFTYLFFIGEVVE